MKSQNSQVKRPLLTLVKPKESAAMLRNQRKAAIDGHMPLGKSLVKARNRSPSPVAAKPRETARGLKLPNLRSQTQILDSVKNISGLRDLCKQCMGYMQQADTMLDQLQVTAKSLQESGVLQKLASKGKKLDAGEWTNILFALINTPIGATLLKRLGPGKSGSSDEKTETEETKVQPKLIAVKPKETAVKPRRPAPSKRKRA